MSENVTIPNVVNRRRLVGETAVDIEPDLTEANKASSEQNLKETFSL